MGDETGKALASSTGPVAETTAARQKSAVPLLVGIGLLVLAGGGGATWFALDRQTEQASPAAETNAPKYLVHLEGFTVNLADAEETHFLRVTMDLGIDHLPAGADKEKAAAVLPVARIRDAILSVLTAGTADALLTPEGKLQLKKHLVETLNHDVPEVGVREVYFTEFLVQR